MGEEPPRRASGSTTARTDDELERLIAERTLQLRESEARYRRLVEGLQEEYFFFTLGPDVTFSYVSPSVENVLGWAPEELLGRRPGEFRTAASRATFERVEALARAGRASEPFVAEVRRARGGTRLLEVRLGQVLGSDGEIESIEGLAHDVTRRIAAEEELRRAHHQLEKRVRDRTEELHDAVDALRRSEHELLAAQRSGRMGSWVLELDENRITWSEPTYAIHGLHPERDELTLEAALSLVHPDDRPTLADTRDVPHDSFEREYRIVRPDGGIRHIHVWAEPEVVNGRVARLRGMVQDVTEQRMAQLEAETQRRKLAEAERMASLGTLLAGLTHELNNPNHSILLNVPVLRRTWQEVSPLVEKHAVERAGFSVANVPWEEMRREVPQLIDEIEQGAERIKRLVARLREYALKHRPAVERLDVNDVVRSVVELMRDTVEAATAEFGLALEPELPPVQGSSFRLEQVVASLLLNACEALESREGAIRVETGRADGMVVVRVQDEGRGIPEDDLARVFDPFFTTRREHGGTGLGLAVSSRIVKEHGGMLELASSPGKGTEVTISLPPAVPPVVSRDDSPAGADQEENA